MLLTVTPNACIERTVRVPGFSAGGSYRIDPQDVYLNVGGKGVNAARVAKAMGAKSRALLWCGKGQREWVEDELEHENVDFRLVETDADTRTCINVLHGDGLKTEIVEAGNPLQGTEGVALLDAYESVLPEASMVAICGSYPPAGADFNAGEHLAELCRLAQARGVRVIVDGKGMAFSDALEKVRPWCIKPNIEEAAALLRYRIESAEEERRAVHKLLEKADRVILSCGSRGCYFGTSSRITFYRSPGVKEVSAVGSGDSLVGAFASRLMEGMNEEEALRYGVAAGAANAAQVKAGFCTQSDVLALLPNVVVESI